MDIRELIENKVFSVSEFNDFVNSILAPLQVTIEGEVTDLRVSQNKFVWFSLKDEQQSLSCFSLVFRIHLPLEDGMKVKVVGYPKIYGKSGRFSFVVESLELSGEGTIKRAYLLLKTKLEQEGLFDEARKRPLPKFPQTLGLITSPQAAAYTDFIKQINARSYGLGIMLAPVSVQGEKAVAEVTAAFDYFNRLEKHRPEVIVLTRGGGGLEDLQAFNAEEVVRAVFSSKIPVISAIGHERDLMLCDLAADARASTPTHAAALAVPDRRELLTNLDHQTHTLKQTIEETVATKKYELQTGVDNLWESLRLRTGAIKSVIEKFKTGLTRAVDRLHFWESRLSSQKSLLLSLAPQNVLARGYSIVRKHGKIIRGVGEVVVGDNLDVALSDGNLESEVKSIKLKI